MRKKWKIVLTRLVILIPATIFQIGWYILFATIFNANRTLSDLFIILTSIILVIFILYKRDEANYKLLWVCLITIFPLFGVIIYLLAGNKKTAIPTQKRIQKFNKILYPLYDVKEPLNEIKEINIRDYQTLKMMSDLTSHPVNYNRGSMYFDCGEKMFEKMLEDLEKAKKFIFIEYFIIDEGYFFDTLKEVLERKVKEGVDVRLMFDDIGSVLSFSLDNVKSLHKAGIKVTSFNPVKMLSLHLNNRDHRKMMIIDNEVAYSGGVNIADEYIHKLERFGDWKDIGFRICGEEVATYTHMFIEFWNAFSNFRITEYSNYFSNNNINTHDGYVLSYTDAPYYNDHLSIKLLTDLLGLATNYVYIYTPYLIISDAVLEALFQAADRGIDVRIIVPGIPDKKLVYRVTRSYYHELLSKGIKVYEYTPGFLHAKAWIVDGKFLNIGSVNLDYRSLYLHFENSSIFYNSKMIYDVLEDFNKTLEVSKEIKINELKGGVFRRIIDAIVRIISPLI